ncbi:hypothetical protein OM076_34370 [Solirubrobacter ginsenosidimutans]|uniref:Uncharacterized protein n=1 Tax=Solirubrobacter ginsenosidimutans TaxID=490573 RepID=A0A9X3S6S1_9ACTN|nr:hypothetical protein [Solirubrobacter ginsenosidimutans]MDA0165406.1 hypothetical protein [Solirubrobacter ginsenosidimutans]
MIESCERWDEHRRRYALVHLAGHLGDELAVSAAGRADEFAAKLAALVTNAGYQRAHQDATADPAGLQQILRAALASIAASEHAVALSPLVQVALAQESFRREWLRPDSIFALAEQGSLREAERRLAMFQADDHWAQAIRLLIAWLAPADERDRADELRTRVRAELQPDLLLSLLHDQVHAVLGGPVVGPAGLPAPPSLEVSQEIVSRLGGATANESHISGFEPLEASGRPGTTPEYLAELQGPILVATAAHDWVAGGALLDEYIAIHAANPYAEYRNRSLWALLGAVLRHPDSYRARDLARTIATAALGRSAIVFQEGLAIAVDARRGVELRDREQEALGRTEVLAALRWRSDSWGSHQRRLAALAEAYCVALRKPHEAQALLARGTQLPSGFAGFQAPVSLTLAESNALCGGPVAPALDAALTAAHNIQEPPFCARTTARVNAMRHRWWPGPTDFEPIVDRLIADSLTAEFSPIHIVGEVYRHRGAGERLDIPDAMRTADTLPALAEFVYRTTPSAIRRLNQNLPVDRALERDSEVSVPDSRFIPQLAARLAAGILAQTGRSPLARARLIRRLVPFAAENPTALDTILSRLVLAAPDGDFEALAPLAADAAAQMDEPDPSLAREF